MTKSQKVNKAKNILADIFNLVGEDDNGDWSLNKATDAMNEYIIDIE